MFKTRANHQRQYAPNLDINLGLEIDTPSFICIQKTFSFFWECSLFYTCRPFLFSWLWCLRPLGWERSMLNSSLKYQLNFCWIDWDRAWYYITLQHKDNRTIAKTKPSVHKNNCKQGYVACGFPQALIHGGGNPIVSCQGAGGKGYQRTTENIDRSPSSLKYLSLE